MQDGRSYEAALRASLSVPFDKLNQVLSTVQALVLGNETATIKAFLDGALLGCCPATAMS